MSVSKWKYTPACDGKPCPGDCDNCGWEPDEAGDLISRQKVLELAKDVVLQGGCKHRCIDATMIYELPSAEPEIIHCRDCAWWRKNPVRIVNRCAIFDTDTSMTFYCKHGRKENE